MYFGIMAYNSDNVNQKAVEQVVGKEVGTSKNINAAFIAELTVLENYEFVSRFPSYTERIDWKDTEALRYHSVCGATKRLRTRCEVLVRSLDKRFNDELDKLDNLVLTHLPGVAAPKKGAAPITLSPSRFYPEYQGEEDIASGVERSGPSFIEASERKTPTSTTSPERASASSPQPHTRRPSPPPVPQKGKQYKDVPDLEVIDLDNKSVMKRIAKYKLKVPTKAPKEKREENVKKMRTFKLNMRDPWRNYDDDRSGFQAQMNFNFNVTHGLNAETRTILNNITTQFATSMATAGEDVNVFASHIQETVGEVEKSLAVGAESTFKALTKMLWAIPLVGACYYYLTTVDRGSFKNVLLGFTGLLSMVLPGGMWDAIQPLWPKPEVEGFVAQSFILQPSVIANIMTLGLTYLTVGSNDRVGMAKGFLRAMPQYSRSVSGWQDLSTFIISLIESFINYVRTAFGYDRMALQGTAYKQVNDWCARVMEVANTSQTGGDILTPEQIETLCALRREGTDLTHLFRLTKEVSPLLHKYLGYLDAMCTTCSAAMHTARGGRAPPVVLAITGEPGVGKTWLTKYITSYLLSSIISEGRASGLNMNLDSLVYQKPSSEYWNGYCGQPAVIVDDFAQSVPTPGIENDYIDLVRMNSSWAYPLNFADLENKGKNFFCSKIILLTTNIRKIDKCLDVIMEPEAITRRIDFGYEIKVRKEFAHPDGKIDIDKVSRFRAIEGRFPYHAWVLYKHKFAVGSAAVTDYSQHYDLRDVLDLVSAKISSNERYYEDNNDAIREMLVEKYEHERLLQAALDQSLAEPPGFIAQCGFNWSDGEDDSPKDSNSKRKSTKGQRSEKTEPLDPAIDAVYEPSVARIIKNALKGFASYTREFQTGFKEGWDEYKTWVRGFLSYPLVRALLTSYVITCVTMMLVGITQNIFTWFLTSKTPKTAIKDELQKKQDVPEECIAQMLSSFRPSDFKAVEERDGKYVGVYRFTKEALMKAYDRMCGTTSQSNFPEGPRFIYRKINGARVVESDVVAQADVYGDDIAKSVYKNLFQVRVPKDGDDFQVGHILAIRGNCFLMPTHYDAEFKKAMLTGSLTGDSPITMYNAVNKNLNFTITLDKFLSFARAPIVDDDVTVIEFARPIMSLRDITDKFINSNDARSLKKARVRLDTVEGTDFLIHRSRHVAAELRDKTIVTSKASSYALPVSFEYLAYTDFGDCGGLVLLEEDPSKQNRRILGIHVAGEPSVGLGLCPMVTREKIEKALTELHPVKDTEVISQCGIPTDAAPISGSFMPLFKCKQTHNTNPMSCLVQTPLFNKWGDCGKTPAPLRPFKDKEGHRINPMENALKAYATPVLLYDVNKVNRACYHAFGPTRENTRDDSREIFSFEEAIAGRPGTDINGIPRNTSPGFPYIFDKHSHKKAFFGYDDLYTFDSEMCKQLRDRVDFVIEQAKKGERCLHIFTDFLKDEPRKKEKAYKGMSRLISSAPLDYVVAFRMYFLAFTVAVQRSRIRNGIAVGINPYTEWNYLARQMQSKGPDCVAGDFKGFDSSEQPDIHWAILDEINAWYNDGPENALIRRVLWHEVVHSRHLGGLNSALDDIYQWNHSLPSGHPMTSILNSYYNLTLFNMTWFDIMGPAYVHRFWEFVYLCVYGDDNILNISRAVSWKFNQETITTAMAAYGMIYTNEDKSDTVSKVRHLDSVSFLKRKFLFNEHLHQFVGPQELDSILYIPYWCKNKAMVRDITLCNVEYTYMELALHSAAVWDRYAPIIRDTVKETMGEDPQQYFTQLEYLAQSQVSTMVWPL